MGLPVNIPLDIRKALTARAHAGRQWPEIGFRDQSARLLAQLLDISLKQRMPLPEERRLIERCQWFDDACRDFFRRHPQAMCIELGAGLSTRFHRLSDTSDWPRFHWVDVDLPQVTESKAGVLPHIDNYTLMGADILRDDWLRVSGWVRGQPLLIVMEGVAAELDGDASLQLMYRLLQQATSATELEILVDDLHPRSWKLWLKSLAVALGGRFSLPLTRCISTLECLGFTITQKKNLLGGKALGLVINYKNKELL